MQRRHEGVDNGVVAAFAGQNQVFVKGCLKYPRVGNSQHRIRRLDVIRYPQPRFRLLCGHQSVVEIAANTEVERQVALRNRVLQIQRQFLHVGVAAEKVIIPAGRQIVRS